LDLEGFDKHSFLKIYLAGNPKLGIIKNKSEWYTLIYQNPKEFLNHQYPNKEKVEKIDLNYSEFWTA